MSLTVKLPKSELYVRLNSIEPNRIVKNVYQDGLKFRRVIVVPPVAEEVVQFAGLERYL